MILQFEAEAVEVEENDLGILFVGFYTEENYLMIQKNLDEADKQDVSSGTSTYYIERDDQSYSGYGGVKQFKLYSDFLEAELDETGRQNLQCDGLKVDFQTEPEIFELLTEKLRFIFGEALTVE